MTAVRTGRPDGRQCIASFRVRVVAPAAHGMWHGAVGKGLQSSECAVVLTVDSASLDECACRVLQKQFHGVYARIYVSAVSSLSIMQ